MTKINKRVIASAHANLDEIAAGNPELFDAIATIIKAGSETDTAIEVASARKPSSKKVEDDEDDLAPVARSNRRKVKEVEEDDDLADDGDDDGDADGDDDVTLSSLDSDSIFDFLDSANGEYEIEGGLTELRALVAEYGQDYKTVEATAGEGARRSERAEALRAVLCGLYATRDAIAEFSFEDIAAAYEEETGDELPNLRGRDKVSKAADLYLKAVVSMTDEDGAEEEDEEEVKPVRSTRRTKEEAKPTRSTRRTKEETTTRVSRRNKEETKVRSTRRNKRGM